MVIKLTCNERDAILHEHGCYDGWTVYASLTDLDGMYGPPRITTTWTDGARYIEDVRHPRIGGGPDVAPCEHYELPDQEDRDDHQ